jgi:hypothetical protein
MVQPWRLVAEEAQAEGLPLTGFATPVVPSEGSPLPTAPW